MKFNRLVRGAAWAGAGLLGAGLVTGIAEAHPWSTSSDSTTASTPSPGSLDNNAPYGRHHRFGHRAERLGRALHGEFVVQTPNGYKTIDLQRGQVTAVNSTSITVKSVDGFERTYVVNGQTKIGKDRQQISIGDVQVGNEVGVMAEKSGSNYDARFIRVRTEKTSTSSPNTQPGDFGGPAGGDFGILDS